MAGANCQVKQQWEVAGGTLEVRLTTDRALSGDEYEQFGSIVGAAESYASEWTPARGEQLEREAEEREAERIESGLRAVS